MKKWLCSPAPAGVNNEITAQFGELLGGVMLSRGITTLDRAREFFGCSSLSDPLLMKDMESTVDVIRQALDEGKKITVYGDYDCDGVTSTAMLYGYLDAMGAEVGVLHTRPQRGIRNEYPGAGEDTRPGHGAHHHRGQRSFRGGGGRIHTAARRAAGHNRPSSAAAGTAGMRGVREPSPAGRQFPVQGTVRRQEWCSSFSAPWRRTRSSSWSSTRSLPQWAPSAM